MKTRKSINLVGSGSGSSSMPTKTRKRKMKTSGKARMARKPAKVSKTVQRRRARSPR